ncbi:MAG TPA: hypothetical protein PKL84_09080 [Candidatus Hydrogenedentes bacterium]|nr:hypothetical protein [Candidatus Hydrogenedentota bacterium]
MKQQGIPARRSPALIAALLLAMPGLALANADLESKIDGVKQILAQSLEKNARLYDKQQTLAEELDRAKAALRDVQQHMAQLRAASRATAGLPPRDVAVEEPAEKQRKTTARPSDRAPDAAAPAKPRAEPSPPGLIVKPAAVAPEPAEPPPSAIIQERPVEKWIGDDLDEDAGAPLPPTSPEDRDASRRAFQALLNIAPASASDVRTDAPLPQPDDNGGHSLAPLQQRVVEYNAAGMSVAQIARELGIGKGEVRLMLSLARQKRV